MRAIITTTLLCLSIAVFSQTMTITTKDAKVQTVRVIAYSDSQIFIPGGGILYAEIDTVIVYGAVPDKLQQHLSSYDIAFSSTSERAPDPRSVVFNEPDNGNIVQALDDFRRGRQAGKGLQLLGAAATGVLLYMQADNRDVEPWMYGAAAGVTFVGFLVDFDAGKKLRVKGIAR